ncbi:MAG: hypothetical protein MJA27_36375 [Pseudanabaenales cyanobacterium]|nr:hypothetical protein [Pseudanabaenales cyanobacterium]
MRSDIRDHIQQLNEQIERLGESIEQIVDFDALDRSMNLKLVIIMGSREIMEWMNEAKNKERRILPLPICPSTYLPTPTPHT